MVLEQNNARLIMRSKEDRQLFFEGESAIIFLANKSSAPKIEGEEERQLVRLGTRGLCQSIKGKEDRS